MKKKTILWSLMAMMTIAMLSIGFTACGDDDDDFIVGTWKGTEGRHTLTLIINAGNSGTWITQYNDSYSGKETESGSFTYSKSSDTRGTFVVNYYDSYSGNETDVYYYEIQGNTMFVYEHGYGDDLEWVLYKQ